MRSSIYVLFFVLQLFIIGVNSGPLPSNDAANELVKDEIYDVSKYAQQVNEDVQLIGSGGYVDLVISGDSLFVDADIKNCVGNVLFCYAAKPGKITKNAKGLCPEWDDFCGFQLIGTDDDISFIQDNKYEKNTLKECSNDIQMHYQQTQYCKDIDKVGLNADSCNAAISTDAPFRIHIKNTGCRVIIKHATIYYPPTTIRPSTIPSPTLLPGPSNNATTKDEKTSDASSGWFWIVLAVVFALAVTGVIVGCFLCWYKKWCIFKEKTTEASPPRVGPIVTTTVEKVAASAKSKKQKSKPPKLVVVTPSKEPSKERSPTLSLAPTPPTKSVKKPKEKKGASPGKKTKVSAKKSPALVSFPSSTEEEAKKTKEKKAKTPPPPAAAAETSNGKKAKPVSPPKNVSKVEKPKTPPPASPGKKEKKTEVQPSAEPFSALPYHPPTPPKEYINEHDVVHTNRQPGQKGRYVNSLELPSYSGGVAVPSKFARPEWPRTKRRF